MRSLPFSDIQLSSGVTTESVHRRAGAVLFGTVPRTGMSVPVDFNLAHDVTTASSRQGVADVTRLYRRPFADRVRT